MILDWDLESYTPPAGEEYPAVAAEAWRQRYRPESLSGAGYRVIPKAFGEGGPIVVRSEGIWATGADIHPAQPVAVSADVAFIREHKLMHALIEAERLAREFFPAAYRRTDTSLKTDGDYGTDYLHLSVILDLAADAVLEREPAFFAALADRLPDLDWSTLLVTLRLASNEPV